MDTPDLSRRTVFGTATLGLAAAAIGRPSPRPNQA